MHVHVQDGEVLDVHLRIFEPPRFFEAFLRGRAYTEPPDITARICGICPVAYQISACLAIEDACGVVVPDEIRLLRRLLYCGEWIESHALHIFFLHAPDLLGYDGAIEMARDHRGHRRVRAADEARGQRPDDGRGWSVGAPGERPGRRLPPAAAGARSCWPSAPHSSPPARRPSPRCRSCPGFEFPEFEQPYLYLSLDSANGYPLESGALVTSAGLAAPVSRVRRARRRAARRALQRPALDVRRPALRRRPAGPLLAELRRALAPGPRGRRGRRARAPPAATRSSRSSCGPSS